LRPSRDARRASSRHDRDARAHAAHDRAPRVNDAPTSRGRPPWNVLPLRDGASRRARDAPPPSRDAHAYRDCSSFAPVLTISCNDEASPVAMKYSRRFFVFCGRARTRECTAGPCGSSRVPFFRVDRSRRAASGLFGFIPLEL
jgi:hypothetical protein